VVVAFQQISERFRGRQSVREITRGVPGRTRPGRRRYQALVGGSGPCGKIPARKVGGHWCLTREDLAEALESFRSDAGPMPRPTDDRGLTETARPTDDRGLTETARRRTSG